MGLVQWMMVGMGHVRWVSEKVGSMASLMTGSKIPPEIRPTRLEEPPISVCPRQDIPLPCLEFIKEDSFASLLHHLGGGWNPLDPTQVHSLGPWLVC